MSSFKNILNTLLHLVYPCYCEVCENRLQNDKGFICLNCLANIPYLETHNKKDNDQEKMFWGKVEINHVTALYNYSSDSPYRHLIHSFKYKNKPKIAIYLGQMLGNKLNESSFYANIDYIIPVPLHRKRMRERGYNQSEFMAKGISEKTGAKVNTNSLLRSKHTETQTKKSKLERWENVCEAFSVSSEIDLNNCHILLVDDVLTTGSTLEACAKTLLKKYNCKISIATLAYAKTNS